MCGGCFRGREHLPVQTANGTKIEVPIGSRNLIRSIEALVKLQALVDCVERDNVRVIFDVGANMGYFAALAHQRWPQARIYAFEPSPAMCSEIARNNPYPEITILERAVFDVDGVVRTFYVNLRSEQNNSLRQDSVAQFNKPHEIQSYDVITETLDAYCGREGISRIDVLKVDIQGGETDLLKGARQMLPCTDTALFEVCFLDPDPVGIYQTPREYFGRVRFVNSMFGGADLAFDRPKPLRPRPSAVCDVEPLGSLA